MTTSSNLLCELSINLACTAANRKLLCHPIFANHLFNFAAPFIAT